MDAAANIVLELPASNNMSPRHRLKSPLPQVWASSHLTQIFPVSWVHVPLQKHWNTTSRVKSKLRLHQGFQNQGSEEILARCADVTLLWEKISCYNQPVKKPGGTKGGGCYLRPCELPTRSVHIPILARCTFDHVPVLSGPLDTKKQSECCLCWESHWQG